ncbi:MAG: hypothetical protein GY749_05160 [Desulfobacteraceae bacterium]|nr:hypothetical protein [Desulfobacteraceae bacterium]
MKPEKTQQKITLKRKLTYLFLCLFFSAIILFISIFFCIPVYVNSRLIPKLAKNSAISGLECKLRSVGLFGADLGSFQISDGKNTAVSVRSVQIDYSPKQLLKKHIKKILFTGIEFNFKLRHGQITIPGLDLDKVVSLPPSETGSNPPISVGSIEVRNSAVICEWNGKIYRLPVEIDIVPQNREWTQLQCRLRCYPRGQEIVATADMRNKKIKLKIYSTPLHLERFADFTNLVPGLFLSGNAAINISADLELDPFKLSSVSGSCEFRNNSAAYRNIALQKNSKEEPFCIKINQKQGKGYNIHIPSISLASPMPARFSGFNCTLKPGQDITGNFKIILDKSGKDISTPAKVLEPLILNCTFSAKSSEDGQWELNAQGKGHNAKESRLEINNANIALKTPEFSISGKGENSTTNIKYNVSIPGVKVALESAIIQIPVLTLKGRAKFSEPDGFNLKGAVEFSGAEIADSKSNLKIHGIQGIIPVKWPFSDPGKAGNISFKSLETNELKTGPLKISVRQKKSGFDLKTNADLGRFMPIIKDINLDGNLEVKTNILFSNTGVKTSLLATLDNASLLQNEKNIAVRGIRLTLSIPDLPKMRSAPKQLLSFEKASFRDINITGNETDFQIESAKSFFIEKSSFKWCNGNVNVNALRIVPENNDYNLVLYCDRLNLAMVLDQFGFAKAEGQGNINGRIPLQYKNGELSFYDAFLFSTPGDEGTIHMTGAEMLTAGIPKNTPQHSQIDLAREALKDFDYKWAKLRFETQGEDLKLKIQFDGKPANPLPFVYKKEFGGFVRVDADSRGSHFQGIRLDVNLGLPINKLF